MRAEARPRLDSFDTTAGIFYVLFCLECFRRNFQAEGVLPRVTKLAASSRRITTVRTYDCRLARFRSWAEKSSCNPMGAPIDRVSDFLILLFGEGKRFFLRLGITDQ